MPDEVQPPPRKRGRPKGSRNKSSLLPPPRMVPPVPGGSHGDDYRHADIGTIVSRQITMLDWAQQAVRNEMKRALAGTGLHLQHKDLEKLEKLSNAIVRAVDALKKSSDLAEELSKRMSPADLLEAACQKIEGQDLPTINYFIKRLRAYRERIAPVNGIDKMVMGDRATDAIASLEGE